MPTAGLSSNKSSPVRYQEPSSDASTYHDVRCQLWCGRNDVDFVVPSTVLLGVVVLLGFLIGKLV